MKELFQDKFREIVQDHDELERKLSQKSKEASKYKNGFYTLTSLLVIILVLAAILKFRDFEIMVTPESSSVIAVSSTWWGLRATEKEIRWMRADQYDFPGWMTKAKNGDWYLYLIDDDRYGDE